MIEPLSGAAGSAASPSAASPSAASASAAAPVWEPSVAAATGTAVEFPGSHQDQDPIQTTEPATDMGAIHPEAPARSAPQKRRSRSVPVLLSFAAVVAVAGLCFTFGRVSAPAGTTSAAGQSGAPNGFAGANASGAPGDFGGFGGSASVTGTVVSVSGSSMTIQLTDGQTVQIAIGSSTTYHNQTAATSSNVAAGDTVQVQVSGGNDGANAGASSAASSGTRTATDVTVTGP